MKTGYIIAWLALPLIALASCASYQIIGVSQPRSNSNRFNNPHTACAHCHGVSNPKGEPLFPPSVEPSSYCLDCHNYSVNHHPVNIVPAKPVYPAFPLYNGEIKCLTCHEIHGGSQHQGTPKMLRGGPYADRRKICFNCHTKEQYEGRNPHKMQDNSGNRLKVNGQLVCLDCHEIQPDPSQDRANMVLFKADIAFLCWRCHPPMHGDFLDKHFLVSPSDEYLQYMNRAEIQKKYSLPLVPRGRITCSTCHNPHQKGIISFEPAAAGADSLHKLRDNNICSGCHSYYY